MGNKTDLAFMYNVGPTILLGLEMNTEMIRKEVQKLIANLRSTETLMSDVTAYHDDVPCDSAQQTGRPTREFNYQKLRKSRY